MAYGNYNADWQSGGKAPRQASFGDTLKRPMRGRSMSRYTNALNRAGSYYRDVGREAEEEAYGRMAGYDPQESMQRRAQAISDTLLEDWQQADLDLQGQLSRRGQARSGYGARQQYDLLDRTNMLLNRELAQNALQGEQLAMRNTENMMGYGMGASGRYLDILAGNRDAEFMERNLRMQERANNPWMRLLNTAVGAGGTVLGGWLSRRGGGGE